MRGAFWSLTVVIASAVLVVFTQTGCGGRSRTPVAEPDPQADFTETLPALAELYHLDQSDSAKTGSSAFNESKPGDNELSTATNSIQDGIAHTLTIVSGASNPGWALYSFAGLADADDLTNVVVDLAGDLPGRFFIGFAEFDSMSWVWRTVNYPAAANTATYPAAGRFINPSGTVYIVVAAWNDTAEIETIHLGAEQNDQAPVASVIALPSYANGTLDTVLDASASDDRDGGLITGYEWDWDGDGTYDESTTTATAGHVYTELGYHYPVVRITDDDGLTDTRDTTLQVQGWSHTYGDGYNQYFESVAGYYLTDYVYAVGYSLDAAVDADVLICKYDRAGTPIWQRTWGGPHRDEAHDAVVDKAGNVYIAGLTASPGTNSNQEHILLLKLNSSGEVVWEKTWKTPAMHANAWGIELDLDGNIYLGCNAYGFHTNNDLLVLKYNPSGTLVMQKLYATLTEEESRDIDLGVDGSIYLTGMFSGSSAVNICTLKLTPEGVVDAMVGAGGPGWDESEAIAVDIAGNAYITGRYDDQVSGDWGTLLIKYDSDLNLDWVLQWVASRSSIGTQVHLMGGYMSPITAYVTGYVYDETYHNNGHPLVLRFDSSGNELLERAYYNPVNHRIEASTFLGGNLILAGSGTSAGGTWVNISGSASTPAGDFHQMWFGNLENVTGIQGTYAGTYADLPGTLDTGGGERDAYIMGYFPDKL